MKNIITILVVLVVISVSSVSFAQNTPDNTGVYGTLDDFTWMDAESVIFVSGRAAMEKYGIKFHEGERLQNFFVSKTLKVDRIPGDGEIYDGMMFLTGLVDIEPNTPMIGNQTMILYLAITERDGVLYFFPISEIVELGDTDFSSYIEGVKNHYLKDDMIRYLRTHFEK